MPFFLNSNDVLGANARIAEFQRMLNTKKVTKLAKNKFKSKKILAARDIPVPKTYARFKKIEDLRGLDLHALPADVAVKPMRGAFGEGIMIWHRRADEQFESHSGHILRESKIIRHILEIIDGRFTDRQNDQAMLEERLFVDPKIAEIMEVPGLPDIRIIVANFVPVMAMIRLPTSKSGVAANLSQGGIAIGIDIATGKLTHACQHTWWGERSVPIPQLRGFEIPNWEKTLNIAVQCQQATGVGYLGVDIAPTTRGPVVLEVNGHPGPVIQVANRIPLRRRLRQIMELRVPSPTHGVRIARELFRVRNHPHLAHTYPALPLTTNAFIRLSGNKKANVTAEIHTGDKTTTFNRAWLEKLNISEEDLKPARIQIGEKELILRVKITNGTLDKPPLFLGRDAMTGFVVDPNAKNDPVPEIGKIIKTRKKIDFTRTDRTFLQAFQTIPFLRYVRAENIEEERERFFEAIKKNEIYNPQFMYKKVPTRIKIAVKALQHLEIDKSPLGKLYSKKRLELVRRIKLFDAREKPEKFREYSEKLYTLPTKQELDFAKKIIRDEKNKPKIEKKYKRLNAEDARRKFQKYIDKHNLGWEVQIVKNIMSRCVLADGTILISAKATFDQPTIDGLIAHEIGVHVMTSENGKRQPWSILRYGTANYLETQEGLAALMQQRAHPDSDKIYEWSIRLITGKFAHENSFYKTYFYLRKEFNMDKFAAFNSTARMKRGLCDTKQKGAFLKDCLYLRGYLSIKKYVKNGGNLTDLWIGKISLDDLPLIAEIRGIRKASILPDEIKN